MKVRMGFVSNSSSSSFCILGAMIGEIDDFNEDKFDEFAKKYPPLGYVCGIHDYYDQVIIGISPDQINENETIKEVKERLLKILQKYDPSIQEVDWFIDGGYDG